MNTEHFEKKDFSDLRFFERAWIDDFTSLLRIPGGYIYEFNNEKGEATAACHVDNVTLVQKLDIWVLKNAR